MRNHTPSLVHLAIEPPCRQFYTQQSVPRTCYANNTSFPLPLAVKPTTARPGARSAQSLSAPSTAPAELPSWATAPTASSPAKTARTRRLQTSGRPVLKVCMHWLTASSLLRYFVATIYLDQGLDNDRPVGTPICVFMRDDDSKLFLTWLACVCKSYRKV
jgi:hypothetical protein